MKITVFSGSIRSQQKKCDFVSETALKASSIPEFSSLIEAYQADNGGISNSDILSGASIMGARQFGDTVNFFPLVSLFSRSEKQLEVSPGEYLDREVITLASLKISDNNMSRLMDALDESAGIILSTPVYFGDRSSVANKLLQISGLHDKLAGKVFGAVSVGAKRNGGQETSVIYSLLEALNHDALVVGNGPPTSQYGGTAIGGKKGSVVKDAWGLETAFGTGKRVAYVSRLLQEGKAHKTGNNIRITILVTMDTPQGELLDFINNYVEKASGKLSDVVFNVEYILNSTIYRCLGCNNCPPDGPFPVEVKATADRHSKCTINASDDAMEKIHRLLLESDGLIIAGLNGKFHKEILYRYQVLIERTRFIRRNHFELSDLPVTAFTLNYVGSRINALHSVKTVTSYIRHNTVIHRPIDVYMYGDKLLDDGMGDFLNFIEISGLLADGRKAVGRIATEYVAKDIGGY